MEWGLGQSLFSDSFASEGIFDHGTGAFAASRNFTKTPHRKMHGHLRRKRVANTVRNRGRLLPRGRTTGYSKSGAASARGSELCEDFAALVGVFRFGDKALLLQRVELLQASCDWGLGAGDWMARAWSASVCARAAAFREAAKSSIVQFIPTVRFPNIPPFGMLRKCPAGAHDLPQVEITIPAGTT